VFLGHFASVTLNGNNSIPLDNNISRRAANFSNVVIFWDSTDPIQSFFSNMRK
jgi:hypothetical protein